MKHEYSMYNSDEELKKVFEWETTGKQSQQFAICGKLVRFMDFTTKTYVIPEGVTSLAALCFVDDEADIFECEATKLLLPSTLEKIEDNALSIVLFKKVVIDKANKSFSMWKEGLYTADGKRLIYVCASDNGKVPEHYVKEGTEVIDACVLNTDVILHIPASVKRFGKDVWDYGLRTVLYAPWNSYAAKYAKEHGIDLVEE